MASAFAIRLAAHHIRHGGIIVYPTDTVYGLGCDPLQHHAVAAINALKQRDASKGLILLAGEARQLADYVALDVNTIQHLSTAHTPTSWIVPAHQNLPDWLRRHNSVAVRITQNPVVRALCSQLGHPLVSTSANPAGKSPATNAVRIHRWFDNRVSYILIANQAGTGKPSTIKYFDSRQTLRD